jgi:hypothetical protein
MARSVHPRSPTGHQVDGWSRPLDGGGHMGSANHFSNASSFCPSLGVRERLEHAYLVGHADDVECPPGLGLRGNYGPKQLPVLLQLPREDEKKVHSCAIGVGDARQVDDQCTVLISRPLRNLVPEVFRV